MVAADPDLNEFTTTSPILTSFNFTDIQEGTGIVKYYLALSKSGTTRLPIMVQDASISSGEVRVVTLSTSDIDFDLTPFNLSKIVNGTATVNFSINSTNPLPTVTIQLRKVSGGVESNLGSSVGVKTVNAGTDSNYLVKIPNIIRINFKKGDFIRFSVKIDNATATLIGTDPANETGGGITRTKTTISIPYELPNQ